MKPAPSFDSTPEFQGFKNQMRRLIAVPKAELDEQMRLHDAKAAKDRASKPSPGAKKVRRIPKPL